ncbi:MAG: hypothetical protein ACLPWS_19020 [Rhodomicrobium sp.]
MCRIGDTVIAEAAAQNVIAETRLRVIPDLGGSSASGVVVGCGR